MTELVESKEDLIRYFEEGAKPSRDWRVGSEYESVAVSARDGTALPFSGPGGVERILILLTERFNYQPETEDGRTLALDGERARITIEPGGQIELSGEQCDTIHCARREFAQHISQLTEVGRELGASLLGLGMQPVSTIDQIELLPKARYRVMFPYMARKGRLGQRMMKQTAGVQTNLDYRDEADAMRKLRVSMGLVPLIYAIFANSALSDGSLNGYQSYRGHIWSDTDPDRCGTPDFAFLDDAGFEDYTDYALDVPMYFLIREGRYTDLTAPPGVTFRRFLDHGIGSERATMDDWANHLATIFTEVRLKRYLEIRTADSQPPEQMLALPALAKGVLYNDDCMEAAWDLVKRWNRSERLQLIDAACKVGLEARAGRIRLGDLANELLTIAREGLARQHCLNESGEDETIYLASLSEMVSRGYTAASLTIERWKSQWNYDVTRLIEGCSYEAEASL